MLERLEATIAARRDADHATSYSARLLDDPALAARKLGEEAVELVVAALSADRASMVDEAADLLYHLLALLGSRGVTLAEVEAELMRRVGTSGLAEKEARSKS